MDELGFAITSMQTLLASRLRRGDLERLDVDSALEICALVRRIGCGVMLARGDAEALFEALFDSGETYLSLLGQLADRGEAGEVARSASAPMTDALAVGALELARRIDGLLPSAPVSDLEDEDDFAWYSAFHALALGSLGPDALLRTAGAFEATRSPFLAPRAKLLRAIAAQDAGAFDAALGVLTEAWHDRIEEERAGGITDVYADRTEWNLFLEGAAIVRAAAARGVPVKPSYPFIPAALLARPREFREPLAKDVKEPARGALDRPPRRDRPRTLRGGAATEPAEGSTTWTYFTVPSDPGPKPAGVQSLGSFLRPSVLFSLYAGQQMGEGLFDGIAVPLARDAGNQLTDFLYSVNRALIVSERARAFFEGQGLGREELEFIPLNLLDKKGRPLTARYFIANPRRVVACLDDRFKDHPFPTPRLGQPKFIVGRIGIDLARVPPDARLFRLDEDPSRVLIRSDLLGALRAANLTGLVETPLGETM